MRGRKKERVCDKSKCESEEHSMENDDKLIGKKRTSNEDLNHECILITKFDREERQ